MDYPKLTDLNPSNCTERSIKIHYPDFWAHIIKNYHCEKWTEKLYWFYHNITDYPKCKVCGAPTKFINLKTGYREFCGYKCMNSCNDIQSRKKETSRRNWGTDNPMQSKTIQTKLKFTIQERYGVDNPFQQPDFKEKRIKTNLQRYGVPHHLQNEHVKNKLVQTQRLKNIYFDPNLMGYTEDGQQIRRCNNNNCDKCQKRYYVTPTNVYFDRSRLGYETCTNLVPIGNSQKSSLEYKVRELLDNHNIYYISNNRKLTHDKKELDIFIPEFNLAIECNGIWSHSVMNNSSPKSRSYHMDKTKQCRKCNIEVIHLWEDWILGKWDIVESILLNKLKLTKNNIYARNTIVKELSAKCCNEFMEKNHIQGATNNSHVRLGLYHEEELVSVMSFSLQKEKWILDRFCNILNTNVVGGASKLLKYFISLYHPDSIISFSSNDISDGNLYKVLGFETDYKYQPSYWYFRPGSLQRDHRSGWSKSEIVRKGFKEKVDESWTEFDTMKELGFFCIYDSGQFRWTLTLN